ncbi:MAG: hypothetical protein ACRD3V_02575 [Vicinamibacteria bacterium]
MMQLRNGLNRARAGDKLKVIVELEMRSPEEKDLERLGELGLKVDRVIGNKVIGSITAKQLPALEGDESVRIVECSQKLRLY